MCIEGKDRIPSFKRVPLKNKKLLEYDLVDMFITFMEERIS
jgi:hypothetical protein